MKSSRGAVSIKIDTETHHDDDSEFAVCPTFSSSSREGPVKTLEADQAPPGGIGVDRLTSISSLVQRPRVKTMTCAQHFTLSPDDSLFPLEHVRFIDLEKAKPMCPGSPLYNNVVPTDRDTSYFCPVSRALAFNSICFQLSYPQVRHMASCSGQVIKTLLSDS